MDTMTQKPSDEYAKETVSDLATLWDDALSDYCLTAELKFSKMKSYNSIEDIMSDQEVQNNFKKFRDKGGKVDKLRSVIKSNADQILSSAQYVAQAASAAFPPSAAILTALTYVMKASKDVSNDYDKIISFFEEMNSFLERIKMLESKVPTLEGYRSHLLRVFTAMMITLGLATKATKEGRMKRWGKTMLRGGTDDDLSGATASLETAMKRLESATGIATLAGVVDIKKDTEEVKENVVNIVGLTTQISGGLGRVDDTTQKIAQALQGFNLHMSAKFDQMLEAQRQSLKKPTGTEAAQKGESTHKPTNLNIVKRYFTVQDDPHARDRDFEFRLIDRTTEWFLERKEFVSWMEESSETLKSPFLWINGEAGMGKSFLAYSAIRELQKSTASDSKKSVAYFYFRQQTLGGTPIQDMLSAAVNQIAKLDKSYCNQVATELRNKEKKHEVVVDLSESRINFLDYIAEKFEKSSELEKQPAKLLFLVLDGLDEILDSNSISELFGCLKMITTLDLNIRVLLSSRTGLREQVEELKDVQIINVAKDDVKGDMQVVITHKLKEASRLHKLRTIVKKAIEVQLLKQADGLLYVDHILRRLNKYHREGPVLNILNELPANLSLLYERIEAHIAVRRTPEQLQTLKLVYVWIAFGKRVITIEEVDAVVKLHGLDRLFSAEDEIVGRSGMMLTIAGDAFTTKTEDEDKAGGDNPNESATPALSSAVTTDNSAIVQFHNRSLRDYFLEARAESTGVRTPLSTASFLMFEVCAQIVSNTMETKSCEKLLQYAASYWALHFADINLSTIGDNDVLRGISILYKLLTNEDHVAAFLEKYFLVTDRLPYTRILGRTSRYLNTRFQTAIELWLDRAATLGPSKLGQQISDWVQEMRAQPRMVFDRLARAHVRNWLKLVRDGETSYIFATSALKFIEGAPLDFTHKKPQSMIVHRGEGKIETTFNAFKDLASDATAHRAVAITLYDNKHYDEARKHVRISLDKCDNDLDRFSTLLEQATIELYFAQKSSGEESDDGNGPNIAYQSPYDIIQEAMRIRPASQDKKTNILIRRALALLGKCQWQLCKYSECVASVEDARTVQTDSLVTGEVLSLIPSSLYKREPEGHAQLIEKLQSWHFFDLMAWLTYEHDYADEQDPHRIFQHVAKEGRKEDFAVEVYEQVIKYLELRNSAGHVRNSLADFYWHVRLNPDKAKKLWLKTTNSEININPSSGSEDDQPIWDAYLNVANVIYHQFRTSSSPRTKIDLLEEMRVLQESRNNGPLQSVDTYGVSLAVIYANMIRKIGSEQDFEDVLTEAFDSCYTALTDKEGWNDSHSLSLLAKVLALVGGLEKEAQIAYSAHLSIIDPKNHGDSDSRAEKEPSRWGEIAPNTWYFCSGEDEYIKDWSAGPLYLCLICADVGLCQKCYDRIQKHNQKHNQDAPWEFWRSYCGKNHKYIKGPIAGWHGVTGGVMTIGSEKTNFLEWLKDLKENKWKKAWENFWLREDSIEDVLSHAPSKSAAHGPPELCQ